MTAPKQQPERGRAQDEVLLAMEGITKAYPSVVANDGVSVSFARATSMPSRRERRGQVDPDEDHLRRHQPDSGTMVWKGEPVSPRGPAQARALGIGMVFQHFSLFETMTVGR